MFRGRSKRHGRGRGGYGSVSKVPPKGLFSDGIWQCNCDPRLPAQHFQTKNGGKNHGRWFYTCQKAQPKRCDFFLWDDEAKSREAAVVLNNSRTELLPSPQTPQKPSPYGLATPQTSTRFMPASPKITTPYTPSKTSHDVPPSYKRGDATQSSTTQGSDSEDEFYDWPASDDEEMSKVADQASSGHSMPPPETPRKAVKTDMLSTPGKRTYSDMVSESGVKARTPWPKPYIEATEDDVFTTPATGVPSRGLFVATSLHSPAETPTPIRYKDIPPTQDSELASELLNILQNHHVSIPPEVQNSVNNICNKHVLYTRGIMRGRDISRAMVKTKDERIAELQGEIEGLKAERETNRAVIRHLRRDMAARKEAGR
ncbi:hypothetical protein N7G274_004675 [Stereocaulon virgatum]|uniref:GRF-type domain-containing protein n=1 Tax=Stereocaulon virgatum TaxID=373712 RepID=A0ABR4ACR0_9LECA